MRKTRLRSSAAMVCATVGFIALALGAACGKTETPKKALGAACAAGSECTTGNCVDQACCNTACDGGCERCDYQPNVGSCTAVPGGQDPDDDCADQGAPTCGRSGACTGNRACAYYAATVQCVAAVCEGTTLRPPRSCDGVGTCSAADGGIDCAPFGCDNTTGCYTACVPDGGIADCASNATCVGENDAGVCKGKPSASCASNAACVSNTCDGGICS